MDTRHLIDAITRQTTMLIAQLSTVAGIRAPLSHVADRVFVDLARQIEAQGVSHKVTADMFGLALRTYQKRVERLSERASYRGLTLWQAVLEFVESKPGVTRERVLDRFSLDGEINVIAVLNDLASSGVLYRAGRGPKSLYRPTTEQDRHALAKQSAEQALCHLAWLRIYRSGPIDAASLAQDLGATEDATSEAIRTLTDDGRAVLSDDGMLSGSTLFVPVGASEGWEAAVLDHYQAVATTIARKLSVGTCSSNKDETGGGTLTFEVCAGHPYEADVHGLMARTRKDVNALWERVEAHNREHPIADCEACRITFYYGQSCDAVS